MRAIFLALIVAAVAADAAAAIRGSVMTAEGNPVPSARVRLYALETSDQVMARLRSGDLEPKPIVEGATDARGNFSIDAPAAAGSWRVQVQKDGYAPMGTHVTSDFDLAGVVLRPAASVRGTVRDAKGPVAGAVVRFRDGAAEVVARTDDEGSYTVPAPGVWATQVTVISKAGYVWSEIALDRSLSADQRLRTGADLTGTVVDADGKTPVAGASVILDGVQVATSGEDGSFRVANPPAKWSSVVFDAGGRWASRSSSGSSALGPVKLGKPSSISGSVRSGNTGLPGARVVLYVEQGMAFIAGESVDSTVTDAKGNFTLEHIPPGRYRLGVRHPLYAADGGVIDLVPGETSVRQVSATRLPVVAGHVVDEDGRALAAARVQPRLEGPGRMAMRGIFDDVGSWSAGDGRFVLRSIPPDTPTRLEARRRELPPARTAPLTASASEPLTGVRITMARGYEVTGVVLDAQDNPIAGVAVRAEETRQGGNRFFILGEREDDTDAPRTDDEGRFSLRLTEGRWDITAGGDGWSPSTKNAVEVSGETAELRFTLSPSVTLRGRVVRKGSGGIPDVNVSVMERGSGMRRAITGPDGAFVLEGLSPGNSMLVIDKSEDMLREIRMVTVPQDDLLIELPPGATLSGRVIDAETKAPVPAFTLGVSGERSGGGMVVRTAPITRSFQNENGEFIVQNVTADPAELIVQAPGYVEKRAGGIEAPAGETRDGIEIALSRGTTVTGRVTDEAGRGLAGVTVGRDENARFIGGPLLGGTATDAEGRFEVGPFEGDSVAIRFDKEGYRQERREVKLNGKTATVDVRLGRGATLTGQVVTDSGAPVAGARVAVRGGGSFGPQASATSDAAGNFRIEGLGDGTVTVSATRTGYTDAVQTDVNPATSGPLRLVMGEGGSVVGTVRGLSASELPGASVEVRSGSSAQRAQVDGSGAFKVEGVAPGTARVTANAGGLGIRRSSSVKTVEVVKGSEAYVELDMSQGYEISGVVRVNGEPAADVMVTFLPADPVVQTRSSAQSDASGRYSATGLEPGPYRVSAMRLGAGDISWQGEYRVESSDRFDIDVESVTLRGRVLDASNGRGVEGAALEVIPAQESGRIIVGPGSRPTTAPDGSFVFRNITPGRWTVRASAAGLGTASETIDVGSSGASVDLRLSPSDGVVLRVVDAASGTPVAAFVSARDGSGQNVLSEMLRPRPDGTITLALPAGSFRLRVGSPGFAPRWINVSSPSAGVTVPLAVGGTLTLNNQGNEPLRVRLIDLGAGEPLSGGPGGLIGVQPGSNPIPNVPPGQLRVEVVDPSGAVTRSEIVTVPDRGTASLDL